MKTIQSNIDHKGVLTLSMNRPDVHNAFDSTMIGELTRALKVAADDNDIRVIILTGIGSSFSAGADANWMRSQVEASQEENQQDAMELARLMRTLNYLQKPTIASLSDPDWVDINTIVEESVVRRIVPKLKAAGARGIVEYPINKIIE